MSGNTEIQNLAERIRIDLCDVGFSEMRMFGGITFMLYGNMLCCVSKKGVMVRVGKEFESEALSRPFAELCLGTGRPMAGFVIVAFEGLVTDAGLSSWLQLARKYVETLPRKAV